MNQKCNSNNAQSCRVCVFGLWFRIRAEKIWTRVFIPLFTTKCDTAHFDVDGDVDPALRVAIQKREGLPSARYPMYGTCEDGVFFNSFV